MRGFQITALAILTVFYGANFVKQWMLHRHGLDAARLGRGDKPVPVRRQERRLAAVTVLLAVVQYGVALTGNTVLAICPPQAWLWIVGTVAGVVGIAYFIMALTAMQDNWRAGIDASQDTGLVQTGIYRFSRNPAFVGFDLMYLGVLLIQPNYLSAVLTVIAMLLFHRQIKSEEAWLAQRFGETYEVYRRRTWRY